MALLDPYNVLPAIEWQTRDRAKTLASRFQSLTGLHLRTRALGGHRTCAQQNAIYAGGRTDGGDIVTYASGCRSWHVLGRALDLDPVSSTGAGQPESAYRTAGAFWVALGGKWGGNFAGFPDIGHFEWHPGLTIEQACPSPIYCDAIEASIQTSAPFSHYMIVGMVWTSLLAGAGYAALKIRERVK